MPVITGVVTDAGGSPCVVIVTEAGALVPPGPVQVILEVVVSSKYVDNVPL
jgi:hypothetical protein